MKYLPMLILLAAVSLAASPASAQDIVTAGQYFGLSQIATPRSTTTRARSPSRPRKDVMKGDIIFKSPSLLRIDFTSPPDQVIAFDGQTLTVYIPGYNAILSQSTADKPGAGSATLATREGLRMLKRNYSVAFESSPAPLPLDGGAPGEQAVRLVLGRTSAAEGFGPSSSTSLPIPSSSAGSRAGRSRGDKLSFDFTGIKTNVGIPEARFVYDSPASANVYNNFLFNSDN